MFNRFSRFGLMAGILALAGCVADGGPGYHGPGPIPGQKPDRWQDHRPPRHRGPESHWGGAGRPRPRPGGVCTMEYLPVCGQRGPDRQTFPNRCAAENAGYRVLGRGQCH
ncbi:MAG: protease inhibitor [Rhizobiales bacterium]|nr:protease inhibitor [Hyphomicrobiales bacterium]